jgi:hypothetical protein
MLGKDSTQASTVIEIQQLLAAGPAPFQKARPAFLEYSPRTRLLTLSLNRAQHVGIDVYLVNGRRLATLADRRLNAGKHLFKVNPDRWGAGMVIIRAIGEDFVATKRVNVLAVR